MYFERIFHEIHAENSNFQVALRRDKGAYALSLPGAQPMLSSWVITKKRMVSGNDYSTQIHIPSLPSIWRILKRKPDVLATIEFTPISCFALLLGKLFGAKSNLLLVESDPRMRGGKVSGPIMLVKRALASFADCVQTNTLEGKHYILNDLRVPEEKIFVAPYITSQPDHKIRRHLSAAPSERVRFVFCNSATHRKGLDVLIDALLSLPRDVMRHSSFDIIGDGPLRENAEIQLASVKQDLEFRFHGKLAYSEIGDVLAKCDVYLSTSRADYRSLGTFEGLSFGLAIIGTKEDGATKETIDEGVNGFNLSAGDSVALAEVITKLATDRDLLASLRSKSQELFETRKFSARAVAMNILEGCRYALMHARRKL